MKKENLKMKFDNGKFLAAVKKYNAEVDEQLRNTNAEVENYYIGYHDNAENERETIKQFIKNNDAKGLANWGKEKDFDVSGFFVDETSNSEAASNFNKHINRPDSDKYIG